MNGGNQYWQYQPPGQPPGGVYYPQPPQRRSTAKVLWFMGAAFTLTIAIVAVMLIRRGNSGPPAPPPPPPVDQASYQAGYSQGHWWMTEWTTGDPDNRHMTISGGIVTNGFGTESWPSVSAFCQEFVLDSLPPLPGDPSTIPTDFVTGCVAGINDLHLDQATN